MDRRDFVKLITFSCALQAGCTRALRKPAGEAKSMTFYVAGVRYCNPTKAPASDDPVAIKSEVFQSKPCYAVFTNEDQRLGYLPKSLVHSLEAREIIHAYVSAVDPHSVPWKRYRVTIITKSSAQPV